MNQTVMMEEKERKVASSGGTVVVYIPREIKEHFKPGEPITISAEIRGKSIVIVVRKRLFKFDLEDLVSFAKKQKLTVKENKIIGDVQIFQAKKNNISLSFTKNLLEEFSPAYVTVSFEKSDLDYNGYSNIFAKAKKLKKEFDVITLPEGDLDTINLLKDPKQYKLTEKKAIEALQKAGKKIGVSTTIRFNSKENDLDQIKSALSKLS